MSVPSLIAPAPPTGPALSDLYLAAGTVPKHEAYWWHGHTCGDPSHTRPDEVLAASSSDLCILPYG